MRQKTRAKMRTFRRKARARARTTLSRILTPFFFDFFVLFCHFFFYCFVGFRGSIFDTGNNNFASPRAWLFLPPFVAIDSKIGALGRPGRRANWSHPRTQGCPKTAKILRLLDFIYFLEFRNLEIQESIQKGSLKIRPVSAAAAARARARARFCGAFYMLVFSFFFYFLRHCFYQVASVFGRNFCFS